MIDVAIIGAGPYGLACASHLGAGGHEIALFGRAMSSWREHMPAGMLLRSPWDACTISDPHGELTLDAYQATISPPLPRPLPLEAFLAYAGWFAEHGVGERVDERRVRALLPLTRGFRLEFDDGSVVARRVVVATGIADHAHRPRHLRGVEPQLALHSGDVSDPARHAGERIAVVGAGQSAVEIAALLSEAGARVTLIARARSLRWLSRSGRLHALPHPLQRVCYPPSDVGPPVFNRLAAAPELMRRLPEPARARISHRCVRPAAADWLTARFGDVDVVLGTEVREAIHSATGLRLRLSDATQRDVDRLVLATGYRLDAATMEFLTPAVGAGLHLRDGCPVLGPGFESSVAGLHFVGAFAAPTFGPAMRFVSGTWFTGAPLARHVAAAAPPAPARAHRARPAAAADTAPAGAVVLGMSYRGLAMVRSLGRHGVPICVARTDEHTLAGHSRYAQRTADLRAAAGEQLDRLLALDAPGWALIPAGDDEAVLLGRHHARLSACFTVASPPWELLRSAYDKRELHALATREGLAQPRTAYASDATAAAPPAPPAPFPLAIKPAFKAGRNELHAAKAWRVDDADELAERWSAAGELVDPAILMLQEIVPGEEQLSFAALCRDGEVAACLTARRLRQWPHEFGRASTHVMTIEDESVERDGRRVLAALGLSGLVEVEFKRDPASGANMLLDVNPRAWGWLSLGERAGVDFTWLLWRQLRGERIEGIRARAGVRWVRLATDLPAVARDLRSHRLTVRDYARSVRRPLAAAVLAGDDPVPALVNTPLLARMRVARMLR